MEQDPRLFPIPARTREKEEQSREGMSVLEFCTSGSGELLWEHKSTLHWALVINEVRYQWELEHCERLRCLLLVEDRHTGPAETQHGGSLKDLPAAGRVPEWWGLDGALSARQRAGGRCFPQPNWSGTCRGPSAPSPLLLAQARALPLQLWPSVEWCKIYTLRLWLWIQFRGLPTLKFRLMLEFQKLLIGKLLSMLSSDFIFCSCGPGWLCEDCIPRGLYFQAKLGRFLHLAAVAQDWIP